MINRKPDPDTELVKILSKTIFFYNVDYILS